MEPSVRKVATASQIHQHSDPVTIDSGMAGIATLAADLEKSGMR